MKNFILNGLTVEELKELIEEVMDEKLPILPKTQIQDQEDILDVQGVAKLLHTTPQNIHAKKRAGKIPFFRFGSRILFRKSEVLDAFPSVNVTYRKNSR
ncbi:MAG: helix-turn-helix domain-containing protein [Bacteroidia bacterium]|nr:helix-turn-helix domain-containing protein [Bacteroidia bacterium]